MAWKPGLVCSSHTISGVMPGGPVPARHDFAARVAACANAGYSGMCLHFRDYRALRAAGHTDDFLSALLRDHGLHDISIEFLLDWFLEGEAGRQARADERTALDAARAFGAHTINVGSDFAGRSIPRDIMRSRFRALCDRAGAEGLDVALEIVPWSDVPDIDAAMAMIEGVPNAGLVIDSWHIFRGGIPLAAVAAVAGDRILCVQLNDADAAIRGPLAEDTLNRKPCGEGVFDLAGFLASLASTGTRAAVSVEIISRRQAALSADEAASVSIAGARRLVEELAAGGGPALQ
jgi:sugar phosphate isomerase/epimerase